ncbi:MAG TPA: hypothetical protein VE133_14060 [Candidatus Sulfotelmatobacter sp.]|nr:hypothetical protein [Candidatus Sulfotelmatobacter sp.]
MRRDIVDRGIEKAENEMRQVLQPLKEPRPDEGVASNPAAGRAGTNSGQIAPDASDQTGTTPFNTAQREDLPERAGISRREKAAYERQVDPEAVKESFEEAELDPTTEREPGEGKPAA